MSQLKVNSIVPVGGLPSGANGGIIQTVQTVKTDVFTTTSGSFTDLTGMSVSITPSSNSNKIMIQVALSYGGQDNMYGAINLLRGSTIVTQGDTGASNHTECTFSIGGDNSNFQYKIASATYTFLDSPSTTSATTYKLQVAAVGSTSQMVVINAPYQGGSASENNAYSMRSTSTITAYEVSV